MSSYNPFEEKHPLTYWQSKGQSLEYHERITARNAAIKWVILESGWKKTRAEMVDIMGLPLTTLDNAYEKLKIHPVALRGGHNCKKPEAKARQAYGVNNRPKMTVEIAEMIRAELLKGATAAEMSIKYTTSAGQISNIRHNKIYVKSS